MRIRKSFWIAVANLLFLTRGFAGSAEWDSNSAISYNLATNWNPQTIPDGATDIATFGDAIMGTNSFSIRLNSGQMVELDSMVFTGTSSDLYTIVKSSGSPPIFTLNSGITYNRTNSTRATIVADIVIPNDVTMTANPTVNESIQPFQLNDIYINNNNVNIGVSGAGGIIKEGAGMLNFGDNNGNGTYTYTGTSTINEGWFKITSKNTFLTGPAIVNDQGTLLFRAPTDGTFGDINGAVTVNSGGTVYFSNTGTGYTVASSLTFNGGTLTIDSDPTHFIFSGSDPFVLSLQGGTTISDLSMVTSGELELSGGSGGGIKFDGGGTGSVTIPLGIDLHSVNRVIEVESGDTQPELTITGAIQNSDTPGTGDFTKTGTGTLRLTGTSTITAATVSEGTLQIDGTLNADITVNSGAILSGSGSLTSPIDVENGATLEGAGISTSGDVTVMSGGTLNMTTTLGAGMLTVDDGGRLQGIGTITATMTTLNGTLAPGTSPGTITIMGPLMLGAASVSDFEIEADGDSDQLIVTGAVTIDPGASLNLITSAGIYLPGTMYTIIDSLTSVTGDFGENVTFSSPGLEASVDVVGNDLVVTLIEIGGIIDIELLFSDKTAGNADQVAFCFDGQTLDPGTDLTTVATALSSLTNDAEALQDAFDQMQPAVFGALNLIQESQMTLLQSTIWHRLQAWGNGACKDLSPNSWNLWVKPVGAWMDQRSHGQNVGYHSNAYGIAIGADGKFYNHLHLGALAGYVYDSIDWKRNRGDSYVHNAYGGAYAAWQQERFHLLASVVGGWNDYHAMRRIKYSTLSRRAYHDNHGWVLGTHVEGGCSWVKKHTCVQPYGRVEYIYSNQDGYREHGSGVLNLKVSRKKSERIRTDVGLDLSQCFMVSCGQIVPNVYVSWVWEKETKAGILKAKFIDLDCPMTLRTFKPIRSIFAPGAGITGIFCGDRVSISLRWDGEFAKRYSNQKALVEGTFGF